MHQYVVKRSGEVVSLKEKKMIGNISFHFSSQGSIYSEMIPSVETMNSDSETSERI